MLEQIQIDILKTYSSHPYVFYILAGVIGAFIGSFLNVLIYRLPILMIRSDEDSVKAFLTEKGFNDLSNFKMSRKNLPATLGGRSYCPKCSTKIPFWLNIPILGWLLLGGKAKCCKEPISFRYPFVEFSTALATTSIFIFSGLTIESLLLCSAAWLSIALFYIDVDEFLLPDVLVYPLIWLGLLFNLGEGFITINEAIFSSIIGYLFLFSINELYKLLKGYDGMGNGDFKLLAASGAWVGLNNMLILIVFACFITLMAGLSKKIKRDSELGDGNGVAFGPGLILGLWFVISMTIFA